LISTSARLLCALVTLLCVCDEARADDNHYQNYLVGERAVGYAGAFTAIADDSSAVFYNPAGLTQLDKSSLSLAAAVYGFANESISLETTGGSGGATLLGSDATTFITYPTTAVWIQRLRPGDKSGRGRMLAAISLITPFSRVGRSLTPYETAPEDLGNGQTLTERGFEVQLAEDDTLWIGLSYAWRPLSWLHVGATAFFTLRSGIYHFYDLAGQTVRDVGGNTTLVEGRATRIAAEFAHYGMVGLLGVLAEPIKGLRVGLTFRTPQLSLGSKLSVNVIQAARPDINAQVDVLQAQIGGDFNDRKPWRASLGVAYAKRRRFGVSVDFSLYGPAAPYHVMDLDLDVTSGEGNGLFPLEQRLIWQLNIGGEYYVLPFLSLRAGFFTNLSSFEGPDSCAPADDRCREKLQNPFGDAIDRFGFAGSVGYELERATITLAASYNFGSTTRGFSAGLTAKGKRSLLFLVLGSTFRF
jgi:hypothetical protein